MFEHFEDKPLIFYYPVIEFQTDIVANIFYFISGN